MSKHSKRYNQLVAKIEPNKFYSAEDAIKLVKETANTKFDGSVEVHINLGIDEKKTEQNVKGSVDLPHGTGQMKKIAVFADGEAALEAKEAGADLIGSDELIQQIKTTGKVDFDIAVATPAMMKNLAQIAKILGPKGLMPSPKNETVTINVKKAIEDLKGGKVSIRNDESGNIHQTVGKVSWTVGKLLENYNIFFEAIKRIKPASVKQEYIKGIYLTSSMGPAIKVNP